MSQICHLNLKFFLVGENERKHFGESIAVYESLQSGNINIWQACELDSMGNVYTTDEFQCYNLVFRGG